MTHDQKSRNAVTDDLEDRADSLDKLAHSGVEPATYRLLIEGIRDYAIFMLDPRGVVTTWNEGARRIKGYAAVEIIGRHFSTFYVPEEAASGKCAWELEIAARDGRFEDEGWRLRKDGSRFWANVVITALRDGSGTLVGYAKVTRDLTERRRAEQERLELEKLHEASRLKDQFLATMSHELRTPLNAIVGWAELLETSEDLNADRPAISTILRNARAQATLIEDILDMSRIVTGKMRLDVAVIDLSAIVREAVEVVRPAANARGVRLVLEGLEQPNIAVGEAVRLQQVAWNFLSNAVKFSSHGNVVTVSLRAESSSLRLSVSDQGLGITPEFLPHVFEPFRQADEGTARRAGGIGLGLAIVKYIVELHGGRIVASSDGPGRGASFSAIIPIRAVMPEVAPPEHAPRPSRNEDPPSAIGQAFALDGIRVLVIDDDADAREVLQALFRTRRGTVRVAASASEGRQAVHEFKPHIVICDIGMPGEDGYEFVRSLRRFPPSRGGQVPAVALTAYAFPKDTTRAIEAGFNYHLAKPADHKTLLRVVQNLLNISGAGQNAPHS